MSEIIKVLQPLLRKFEGDNGLVINEAKEEAGSKLGDNYTSQMIRTSVVGKYGNGSLYKNSLMTKVLPPGRILNEILKVHQLFTMEKHVYEKILPLLGDFGPPFIHAGPEEIIMLDMREKGYVLCERRDYLDLEHCLFGVKTLAKWHARSLAIKLNNPETFKKLVAPIKEVIFDSTSDQPIGKSIENTVVLGIQHMNAAEPRTAEVERAIEFLRSFEGKCYNTIEALISVPPEKYSVILHGDPWENNILFKHDENGKVIDLKFVDYQITRHNSLSMDFHYFVYTSARNNVIENHYEELIEAYHRTFIETLKKSNVSEEHIKNLDMKWFKSELNKFSLYGLFTGLWLVHAILADDNNLPDMDKLTSDDIATMNPWGLDTVPIKVERIKCVVLHYMRTYQ